MPTCTICNEKVGLLNNLLTLYKNKDRCRTCQRKVAKNLEEFRNIFSYVCENEYFSDKTFQNLYEQSIRLNLDWKEALNYIRYEYLKYLKNLALSDSILNKQESNSFYWLKNNLPPPQKLINTSLEKRIKYYEYITNIRLGELPSISTKTHLESDETCHLETKATYKKVNLRSTQLIHGRLLVTNKKMYFLSQNGGWKVLWKNVRGVQNQGNGIFLELSVKSGNGFYKLPNALLTEAIITTKSRLSKRQLLKYNQGDINRHIPQNIKTAVWQRDQGKCVQCNSRSYLEFDHIIPFSKGGANTIKNLQLLCRKCNLKKGNRI